MLHIAVENTVFLAGACVFTELLKSALLFSVCFQQPELRSFSHECSSRRCLAGAQMAPNWSVGCRWLTGAHLFVGCGGWLAPGSLWQVADRLWSVFTLCVHVVRALLFAFFVASTLSLRTCRAQMNFDAFHATRALGRCRGAGQPRPLIAVRASLPPAPRAAVPAMPKMASLPATPRKSSAPASPPKGVMPTAAEKKYHNQWMHKKVFTKKVWNTSNAAFTFEERYQELEEEIKHEVAAAKSNLKQNKCGTQRRRKLKQKKKRKRKQ